MKRVYKPRGEGVTPNSGGCRPHARKIGKKAIDTLPRSSYTLSLLLEILLGIKKKQNTDRNFAEVLLHRIFLLAHGVLGGVVSYKLGMFLVFVTLLATDEVGWLVVEKER